MKAAVGFDTGGYCCYDFMVRREISCMEQETNRQKQAAETRRKIFECAQDLFTRDSYESVKISDICKAANVSVGAFYHHFRNKETILNEGYRQFDRELQHLWEAYTPTSHRDAIGFLIKGQLKAITRRGSVGASQFFKNQLSDEEKYILNKKERFFYQTLLSEIQAEIDDGGLKGDAEEITDVLLRTSRGLIYDWCLHDGNYDIFQAGEQSLHMVFCYYRGK